MAQQDMVMRLQFLEGVCADLPGLAQGPWSAKPYEASQAPQYRGLNN